jgi:hypothetical protein
MNRILRLDRRIIFLLVAAAMLLPLVHPFAFPGLSVTPAVQNIYDRIESLPPGSNLLVSFDFDPSSKPELEPQARAVLRHAFSRHLHVIAVGLWVTGRGLAQEIVTGCAREAGARPGEDYTYLGWQPGGTIVIIGLGQDIAKTFPCDARGESTTNLPVMRGVKFLPDIQLLISIGAGDPGPEQWIVYGGDKYHVPMAAGTTSIQAAALAPYVQTGQLVGMLNGMKGAAEYERLIGQAGTAIGGMDSMALGGFLILALVLVANAAYLLSGRKPGGRP